MSNGDAVLNAHVKCKGEQRNMNAEICKERNFLQAIYKIKIFFVCLFLLCCFRNERDKALGKHRGIVECFSYKRLFLSPGCYKHTESRNQAPQFMGKHWVSVSALEWDWLPLALCYSIPPALTEEARGKSIKVTRFWTRNGTGAWKKTIKGGLRCSRG